MFKPPTDRTIAIDYGSILWRYTKDTGFPNDGAQQVSVPGKKKALIQAHGSDFVPCCEKYFELGFYVVTEASTIKSFGVDDIDQMIKLLELYPGHFLTIHTSCVKNLASREGIPYKANTDHGIAAELIWRTAIEQGTKVWEPRDESLVPKKIDPLRHNIPQLVSLRAHGYPEDRMEEEVYAYLPAYNDLTETQQQVMGDGKKYLPDQAAAIVLAILESYATNREKFMRVVGANRDRRGNLYGQMLFRPTAGEYLYKHHKRTRLSLNTHDTVCRQMRSIVLSALPATADNAALYDTE